MEIPTDKELLEVLGESHRRGFLGPGPIEPHLGSAQGFAEAMPRGFADACLKGDISLLDMGSGGGLPGLPLLRWIPDLRGILVDARSKRTRFLDEALDQLGLTERVQTVTGRIEESLDLLGTHDVVTARSFGPPSATVELASHLLNPDGHLLVSEPPGGRLWAADGLAAVGLQQVSAAGSQIASFKKVGDSPGLRRWKHLVERPSVLVSPLRGPA